MNKLYGLLTAAVICSAVSALVASEGPLAKPFFDQKTQDMVKNTAKNYALGYAVIYGVATGLAWDMRDREMSKKINFFAIAREFNSAIYKPITRSILFTAPVIFGSAIIHYKCQEYLCEKNAA